MIFDNKKYKRRPCFPFLRCQKPLQPSNRFYLVALNHYLKVFLE